MMEADSALKAIVNKEAIDFHNVGTISLSDLVRVYSSSEGAKFFEEITVTKGNKKVEEADSFFDTFQISAMEFYQKHQNKLQ